MSDFGRIQPPRWQLLLIAMVAAPLIAAGPRTEPPRRARPPAGDWDKATAGVFFPDAFAELQGPRPDFLAAHPAQVVPGAAAGTSPGEPAATADGFKWSTLVSGDTLTDEIKDMKDRVTPTVASPSTFKGGGYGDAQTAFSMLALVFGVIAAHDDDVRWKKDAATARDLFARAGFNCKVGTDQSFKESKLRVDDLAAMLDGNPPQGTPDRDDDFRWSQVAGRPPLMTRLEEAEQAIGAATASSGEFTKQLGRVVHEAEIVAAIGQVIHQPDFEHHDDDSYRSYAAGLRDAAVSLRRACLEKDLAAATAAAAAITKSCNDCHGDYR
ncbi:MAG: hypothetical protein ACKOCX_03370 [Planctomycetota bacterium]